MRTKILVVEDSATDRLIIQRMLSDYNVVIARDGIEAVRQVKEHGDIDLVILDLKMPGMDGFEVLKELGPCIEQDKLRVIILTNYDELDNEIMGLQLGAVDFVRKPVHMAALRARIGIHAELLRIQRTLEQQVKEQKSTFDVIFDQAAVGIAIRYSSEAVSAREASRSDHVSINPVFEQITGRTKEELIRIGWASITHPDDLDEDLKNYERLQSGKINGYTMDKRLIRPDGSVVWVHWIMARLALSGDSRYNHICLVHDITERKRIEEALIESERSKSVLLSHLPGLAYRCSYDPHWTMQYVSEGCLKLTGYLLEMLLNNRDVAYIDIIAPEYRDLVRAEWNRVISARLPFRCEYEIVTASGDRKWVLEMGEGIYSEAGEVEALEGIIIDITDRKAIEDTLKYASEHDRLTGLYNLSYFERLLRSDAEKESTEKRAIVGIDLRAVQSLTLTYGFHYTEGLIRDVVDSLKMYSSDKCTLFSMSDNHLAFYLKGYSDKAELTSFCEAIANTLRATLEAERVGCGIGVLEINQDNEKDVEGLLRDLLIASESATDSADRDFGICFYDAEIEKRVMREHEIKSELTRIAINADDGSLYLQYQPILDLRSGQIWGFEALARLRCKKFGEVSPFEFIPIAEKNKLIVPVGKAVFLQAFRFLNKLSESGFGEVNVSVNVSVTELLTNGFFRDLLDRVQEMGVNPTSVGIEITESALASDFDDLNRVLGELRDAGIHISIDDFGTGYSSLAREGELNIDCLKIDKYFVDRLMHLKPEESITGDIVSMAHRLGHHVTAEGVEHERQRQYLLDYGCDRIQGHLVSKPLHEDAAIRLLRRMAKRHLSSD
ncbi:MAG: EAL domain-containing protein [Bacillota bacterium]